MDECVSLHFDLGSNGTLQQHACVCVGGWGKVAPCKPSSSRLRSLTAGGFTGSWAPPLLSVPSSSSSCCTVSSSLRLPLSPRLSFLSAGTEADGVQRGSRGRGRNRRRDMSWRGRAGLCKHPGSRLLFDDICFTIWSVLTGTDQIKHLFTWWSSCAYRLTFIALKWARYFARPDSCSEPQTELPWELRAGNLPQF